MQEKIHVLDEQMIEIILIGYFNRVEWFYLEFLGENPNKTSTVESYLLVCTHVDLKALIVIKRECPPMAL